MALPFCSSVYSATAEDCECQLCVVTNTHFLSPRRAQVYMVSMATDSSSHLPPTPSHKPHNMHKGVRRHHSHRVANKENASDSVKGKVGHTTHRAIQVKEWIV